MFWNKKVKKPDWVDLSHSNKEVNQDMVFKAINKSEVKPIQQAQPIPEAKPAEPKSRYVVVEKLPVQEIRQAQAEDGTIINYITIEEYLTAQANE